MYDLDMGNGKGFQTRLSSSQKEEIRSLYLSGVPPVEIVQSFGCSTSNFWNVVRGLHHQVRADRFYQNAKRLELVPHVKMGWIAGIIDGEGWIGITRSTPRVDVSSTTRSMQDELHGLIGGHIYHMKRSGRERDLFSWQLWSAETILPFIRAIESLLVVKKGAAQIVGRFCERRLNGVTDKLLDERDASAAHEFNKKGKR